MYLRALMEFLYPSFLYALTAISIPIIIHLFNFRRFKKIYFTNVKFLREIKQETQSKSNLKHLLVLLARILAVAFLVLAFAQPYLPAENNKAGSGQKTVSVYIDNSFSMEAVNDEGRLLSQAKNAALEIANAYRPTDVFQLLTNDFEGRHQRLVNREEFIELVDEVEISPAVKLVSKIVGRQKDRLLTSETQDKTIFLISDFQKNTSDFSSLENDTTVTVKLLLMQAQQQSNLYVDSCWFATPFRQLNHPEKLTVRVKNISEKGYENIPIKLTINGRQKALASFSIEPQSWSDTSLYFTSTETGIQQVEIAITDYPVTFDDNFYLSYEVAEYISVLCINAEDTNKFIHSLFKNDDFIQLHHATEKSIDYNAFAQHRLIILAGLKNISSGLAQELKKFTENGGSLLLFPAVEIDEPSYMEFLLSVNANYFLSADTNATQVSQINTENLVFKNVFDTDKMKSKNIDLPKVKLFYPFSKNIETNEEFLLTMENGSNFLSQYTFVNGKIYLCSSPLNEEASNFPKHAIFVPVIHKIALMSLSDNQRMYYTLGDDESVELNNTSITGDNVFHITSDNGFDVIPEHKIMNGKTYLFLHKQIEKAGNYFVKMGQGTSGSLSLNYNRLESNLSVLRADELTKLYEKAGLKNVSLLNLDNTSIANKLAETTEGKKLWKWCIILVLVFLGSEILLLKFWK